MKTSLYWWIGSATIALFGANYDMAATITWDGGGNDFSWETAANWGSDVKPSTDDVAAFGWGSKPANPTFSLNAKQTVSGLKFSEWGNMPDYLYVGTAEDVASGFTLTLQNVYRNNNLSGYQLINADVLLSENSLWDIQSGWNGNLTVNGTIGGEGLTLTKTGGGTLVLNGQNTYGGPTTVSAGTLQIGDGTRTGSTAGEFINNATLIFSPASGGKVFANNISGTGSVVKVASGTLILGGATSATSTGSFTISDGTIDTSVPDLVISNSNYAWNGDFAFFGSQNLDLGSGNVSLSGDRIVTIKNNTLAIGGAISGARKLTKQGDGTLELRGTNTYSGGTAVNVGTLLLKNKGAAGTASVIVGNDGTVILDNSSENAPRISDSAAVFLAGQLVFLGNDSASSSETIGVLTNGNGAASITLSPGSGQSALLTFSALGARSTGFTGLYRGTGLGAALDADTANIKFLTAPTVSSYGAFAASDGVGTLGTVNAAVLRGVLFDNTSSGTGQGFATYQADGNGVRLLDAATEQTNLYVGGTANVRLDLTTDTAITGTALNTLQLENSSGSTQTVTNSGTSLIPHNGLLFTGTSPITLTGGTLNANLDGLNKEAIILVGNTGGTTISTAITGTNITVGGNGALTLGGSLTAATYGNGFIRINNAGTTTLAATSTGALVINDGTVKLATGGKLYEADSQSSGTRCYVTINRRGKLDCNGISPKSNGLTGSGVITNSTAGLATLTCDWRPGGANYFSYAPDFSGSIGGNLKLTITGGDYYIYKYNQILSGTNTFTGGITLGNSAMTLSLNSPTALGTGPLTINGGKINSNGQTLTTDNSQNWNNSFTFTGSGSLNMGKGTVTLGNATTTVNVSANTLTIGGSITEGAGGRGLTKSGAGTLVLNGACTYTGATTVNTNSLVMGYGSSLASTNVIVSSGAMLVLNGTNILADTAQLTIATNGVVTLNNAENEMIRKLVINGVEQPRTGTYGSLASRASIQSAYFAGTGLIEFAPSTLIVIR